MDLCKTPNIRSPKPSFTIIEDGTAKVTGYNNYVITKDDLIPDNINKNAFKYDKLKGYLTPARLTGKSVLDIGCGTGFWSILASRNGADCVTAIDIDASHINTMNDAIYYFNIKNINGSVTDIKNYSIRHDIVLALAIVHWIYSCTTVMSSLENMINHLRSLTGEFILIEWIGPDDSAVKSFGHLTYNERLTDKKYTREEFLKALSYHFPNCKLIGEGSRPGRELYYAHV